MLSRKNFKLAMFVRTPHFKADVAFILAASFIVFGVSLVSVTSVSFAASSGSDLYQTAYWLARTDPEFGGMGLSAAVAASYAQNISTMAELNMSASQFRNAWYHDQTLGASRAAAGVGGSRARGYTSKPTELYVAAKAFATASIEQGGLGFNKGEAERLPFGSMSPEWVRHASVV